MKLLRYASKRISVLIWGAATLLLGATQVHAEDFATEHGDFFRLLFPQREDVLLQYQYEPGLKEDGGPGKLDLNHFSVDGEVPLEIGDDSYFRLGGGYSARVYDFHDVPGAATNTDSNTFHRADLVIGAGTFLSKNVLLSGAATIGTYTDFDGGLKSEDFRVYGDGEAVYRVNPGAELLVGVRWSEDFDEAPVFPYFGFRLLSEDGKLHIAATAPLELRVGYSFDPEIEAYGRAYISGEEYRISSGARDNFRVHLQDRRAGLGLNWWLTSRLKLGTELGVSLGNEFTFKTSHPGQFEEDLKTGGYFVANVGIAL